MEKLLIVDDEEIELDGMAELIDWPSYGYELVGTAINGKRGLALIQEKQPDIVITDIKMPVMDGLAMIRAAQEQHVDTVFVVLSGYGDYEYTSQAMQLGIRHYILKPCDEAKILPVLEQARAELHERRSKAQKTTELVGTAINGKRGLALIQEKQPDIVITDIKMPVMDGLAMIRAAQEQHVDTVFVVLSGYGDYEYTSQAMQLGIRHYILKPCDEAKILPVLEQARAELHERRSKAQKTTEMENTVRRMAPMAREKALRDLLLGRETLTHLPGIADDLGGLDRKLLLLLLHTKEGIDHLEQYAITNMMAELLPEGGLLGDTSVSQDVCLLVDAGLYDQLPPAVERLCDEFARFRAGLLTVTGSARGTAAQMAELYEQARRLQAAAPENTLTLLERLNAEQHAAAHLMNYDTLRNADSYAALCFACCDILVSMQMQEISPAVQRDFCMRAVRYICGSAPTTTASTHAELLIYLVDNIWQHRTGDEPIGKATRTEQMILREFYAYLPEKNFTMQWFAREILFMNPDYLSRKIEKMTGDKFATRLIADRIEIARHLLTIDPTLKMTKLAETVGFAADEQYFSRIFRKLVGATPKQYAMGIADKQIIPHGRV